MIRHKEKWKKRKEISQRRQEEVTIHELINMTYVEPDVVGVGGEWAHLPISRVPPARLEGKGRDTSREPAARDATSPAGRLSSGLPSVPRALSGPPPSRPRLSEPSNVGGK